MDTNIISYERFKEALERWGKEKPSIPVRQKTWENQMDFIHPKRQKQPIVLSVLPGENFPFGHEDLRPLLQRDGLILLSWAVWNDWDGDLAIRFVVNWVTSSGRARHYASGALAKAELPTAMPLRRGDNYFYRGIFGRREKELTYVQDKDIADYVYLAAPFDLNPKTIPAFVKNLKGMGNTVDFDFPFSIDLIKKIEFAKCYNAPGASIEETRCLSRC
jgi:hypothetical protein